MFATEIVKSDHIIESAHLKRNVALEVFMPELLAGNETLNLLLLNDGQEAGALQIQLQVYDLYASGKMEAVVVVAIKASDERVREYGVAGFPDYQDRGDKADAYSLFITEELLPALRRKIAPNVNGKTAFVGFSLGGLSAFDIVYCHPDQFDMAGVFSGAFWWRTKDLNEGYIEELHRIMHHKIRNSPEKPAVKFWLMTGTADETADRNHNFIIDSIDDTIDVIKELVNKGFQRPSDVFYYEMVGGKHEVGTWAQAFPAFLLWAFPRKITASFN